MTPLEWFMTIAVPVIWVTALAHCFDWSMRDILTWISKIPRNVLCTGALVILSPILLTQAALGAYEWREVSGNVLNEIGSIFTEIRDLWTLKGAWGAKDMPLQEPVIEPVITAGRVYTPDAWPTGEAAVRLGLAEYDDFEPLAAIHPPTATNANALIGLNYWMGMAATGTHQEIYNQLYEDMLAYFETPPKTQTSSITPTPEHRVH